MDKKRKLKRLKVRTVGHRERRLGVARGPLQAALGDTARGAPSRDGERRGSGGEERTGGDHVGSILHFRKLPGRAVAATCGTLSE